MSEFLFHALSEADTDRLAAALATALPGGTVVGLHGTLGAGKTRFVQGVAKALGVVDQEVVSPTFVLVQEYQGDRPIYHFDAYRLRDDDEFLQLGPDEYFESSGLSFVEWADRVEACLPRDRLDIWIKVTGESSRQFTVQTDAACYAPVIAALQESMGG